MSHIVYNIVGTSSRRCQCTTGPNTWLGHWSRGTGEALPATCVAKYCSRAVAVGAHVKDADDLRIVWIVPFCSHHNSRPGTEQIPLRMA